MTEKQLTITLSITLAVIFIAGLGIIYYYHFSVAPQIETEISVVDGQITVDKGKRDAIKGLEVRRDKNKAEIAEIVKRIPEFGLYENDVFAELLDKLRKKTKVLVLDARFRAPNKSTQGQSDLPVGVMKATYELKVVGGFFQLLNFVYHLESETRFLVAENIKFAPGANADEKAGRVPIRELSFTISTYMKKGSIPGAVAVAPDQPEVPQDPNKPPEKPELPEVPKRNSTPSPAE